MWFNAKTGKHVATFMIPAGFALEPHKGAKVRDRYRKIVEKIGASPKAVHLGCFDSEAEAAAAEENYFHKWQPFIARSVQENNRATEGLKVVEGFPGYFSDGEQVFSVKGGKLNRLGSNGYVRLQKNGKVLCRQISRLELI